MKSKLALVAFVASLFFVEAPLFAHHGFELEYDASKYITVTGVLTKVDWENPHIYFNVDAKDASGKVTSWRFEGSSVAIVERTGGRRRDLVDNIGQTVTVSACRAGGGVQGCGGEIEVAGWKRDGHRQTKILRRFQRRKKQPVTNPPSKFARIGRESFGHLVI